MNSCGVTPVAGRSRLRSAISPRSPATNPLRYPVIDERFDNVLIASTFVRSESWSTPGGGSSPNHSSEYASSDASTTSCIRHRSAASSKNPTGAIAPVGLFG